MAAADPNVPSFSAGARRAAPPAANVPSIEQLEAAAAQAAPAKPETDAAPYGYRVMATKKISTRTGVLQFHEGKILPAHAYGDVWIRDLKAAGLRLEPVQNKPEF